MSLQSKLSRSAKIVVLLSLISFLNAFFYFCVITENPSIYPCHYLWTYSCERKDDVHSTIAQVVNNSSCDYYATLRGAGQNVVAYTFFGQFRRDYFEGIVKNAQLVSEMYPGWLMRVYHNVSQQDEDYYLRHIWCKYPHLDLCHIERLPPPLRNQANVDPRVWRFNVIGDPLVDRFLFRDLDSLITDREVAAVNQWISSGKTWHFMHDHPGHTQPILAGMCDGRNVNLKVNVELRERILSKGVHFTDDRYNDQNILKEVLLPLAEEAGDYMNHDSFYCGSSLKQSTPWPVQRKSSYDFVGAAIGRGGVKLLQICPIKCRPAEHKDWLYC